jgi:hypothetical protein
MDSNDDDDLNDLFREVDEILAPVGNNVPPNLGAPVSEPPMWTPPEGWGTVRDYVVVRQRRRFLGQRPPVAPTSFALVNR